MKTISRFNLIALCIFALSCGSPTENKTTTTTESAEIKQDTTLIPSVEVEDVNVNIDSSYNNLSNLIAGYPINYYQPQWDKAFIESFNKNVNQKMLGIESSRLSKIKSWNETNIKNNGANDTNFVFYPFSGGDFIHMAWLYPNANEYFMIARELVGDIPNLFTKDSAYTSKYLKDIEFVLRDIYSKSYFITKNMRADTKHNTNVNGMLPLILWGAVRTGHDISQVSFGKIDENGDFTSVNNHEKSNIVQVIMWNKKLKKQQKVTYFCCDLANDELLSHPGNMMYLEKSINSNCNTFIKSASYLLHYGSFTTIRDFVLSKSTYLVQDDTGIPYQHFNNENWKVSVFGVYEKPVKDFSDNLYQEDLDSAYRSPSYLGDLNFSLGYHWGSKKQNQIIAKKKQ
jgi:hypothetical protein